MYLFRLADIRMILFFAALLTILINLPFGYWRHGTKRFSFQWYAAIHIPVLFVIAMRIIFDYGWKLYTFPIMIGAFFLGQYLGGKIRSVKGKSEEKEV